MGNGYETAKEFFAKMTDNKVFRICPKETYMCGENVDYAFIKEAVELPDGDILLGIQYYDAKDLDYDSRSYFKLSDLHIDYYSCDSEED